MVNKNNRSKKVNKSGPNVMRLFRGGGCSAPEIVSQYISPPNSNIPAGYHGVQSIFQRVFYTPGAAETNLVTPTFSPSHTFQSGGGYIVNPSETIGKSAVIQSYPQKAEPLILDGKVIFQGCESQCGAGKISSYRLKKMTQRRSKSKSHSNSKLKFRSSKSKSKSRSNSKKQKRTSQRKVVRKEKKHSRRRHGQHGGNEGEKGNFSPDMMTRDFEGKQPTWNVNTI
jgi:hypothetical protein